MQTSIPRTPGRPSIGEPPPQSVIATSTNREDAELLLTDLERDGIGPDHAHLMRDEVTVIHHRPATTWVDDAKGLAISGAAVGALTGFLLGYMWPTPSLDIALYTAFLWALIGGCVGVAVAAVSPSRGRDQLETSHSTEWKVLADEPLADVARAHTAASTQRRTRTRTRIRL